jgi:hypothetical protein
MPDLKLGSKGSRVRQVQDRLLAVGETLPKWGPDGELGWETWHALMAFAQRAGLLVGWAGAESGEGPVPAAVLAALLSPTGPAPTHGGPGSASVRDLTRDHALTKGRPGPRSAASIRGIVLHQTACRLGGRPQRWWNVACHLGIGAGGEIFYVNHWSAYVWHANAANAFTLGIEIDGRYEGVEGRRKTLWGGGDPDVLDARRIRAARDGVRWLVETARAAGCPLTHVYAHRQFSASRRSDPGSAIWREVGTWAQQALGLVAAPSYTSGDGMPLPREWDPAGVVDYYGKA